MQSSVKVDLDFYLDQMWLILSVCHFVIGNAHIDGIQGNQFHLGGTYGKVQTGTKGSSEGRCLEEWNFDFGQVFSEK